MEFRILGPLEVVGPEGVLRIGGGKRRALLALLLLRPNDVVSADTLIESLWGRAVPASPRTALHVLVSDLRKELGRDGAARLETHGGGYALRLDPGEVDSDRFAQALADARGALEAGLAERAQSLLRPALDLWRGPPLQEFTYDDFAQTDIARLVSLRADAEEELVEAELALGRQDDAITALHRLVREHPERERRRAQLMVALYRAHRQSDALAAYQDARAYFAAELGVEPGPELRRLHLAILNQDPSLEAPARRSPIPRRRRRSVVVAVAVAAAAAAAGTVAIVHATQGSAKPRTVALAPHSLAVVDPAANQLVTDVRLLPAPRATPFEGTDLAVGFGAVWVADAGEQTLLRVDLGSHAISSPIGIGEDVRALAVGFGSVWVADGNSAAVSRVDPRDEKVSATIALGAPNASYAIAVGAGSVWATAGSRSVVRIDPLSERVVARVPIADVTALAGDAHTVFCGTQAGTIERIVVRDGRPRVTQVAAVQGPVQRLQVIGNALWAVVQGPQFEVWQLDSRDGHVVSTIEVGQIALGLAATRSAVFVPLYREGELITIAPVRNAISRRLVLRPRVSGVASSGSLLWVLVA
jgi:DNA-binding SARP family transcriptional activator